MDLVSCLSSSSLASVALSCSLFFNCPSFTRRQWLYKDLGCFLPLFETEMKNELPKSWSEQLKDVSFPFFIFLISFNLLFCWLFFLIYLFYFIAFSFLNILLLFHILISPFFNFIFHFHPPIKYFLLFVFNLLLLFYFKVFSLKIIFFFIP